VRDRAMMAALVKPRSSRAELAQLRGNRMDKLTDTHLENLASPLGHVPVESVPENSQVELLANQV
jgi:hypothetical protein